MQTSVVQNLHIILAVHNILIGHTVRIRPVDGHILIGGQHSVAVVGQHQVHVEEAPGAGGVRGNLAQDAAIGFHLVLHHLDILLIGLHRLVNDFVHQQRNRAGIPNFQSTGIVAIAADVVVAGIAGHHGLRHIHIRLQLRSVVGHRIGLGIRRSAADGQRRILVGDVVVLAIHFGDDRGAFFFLHIELGVISLAQSITHGEFVRSNGVALIIGQLDAGCRSILARSELHQHGSITIVSNGAPVVGGALALVRGNVIQLGSCIGACHLYGRAVGQRHGHTEGGQTGFIRIHQFAVIANNRLVAAVAAGVGNNGGQFQLHIAGVDFGFCRGRLGCRCTGSRGTGHINGIGHRQGAVRCRLFGHFIVVSNGHGFAHGQRLGYSQFGAVQAGAHSSVALLDLNGALELGVVQHYLRQVGVARVGHVDGVADLHDAGFAHVGRTGLGHIQCGDFHEVLGRIAVALGHTRESGRAVGQALLTLRRAVVTNYGVAVGNDGGIALVLFQIIAQRRNRPVHRLVAVRKGAPAAGQRRNRAVIDLQADSAGHHALGACDIAHNNIRQRRAACIGNNDLIGHFIAHKEYRIIGNNVQYFFAALDLGDALFDIQGLGGLVHRDIFCRGSAVYFTQAPVDGVANLLGRLVRHAGNFHRVIQRCLGSAEGNGIAVCSGCTHRIHIGNGTVHGRIGNLDRCARIAFHRHFVQDGSSAVQCIRDAIAVVIGDYRCVVILVHDAGIHRRVGHDHFFGHSSRAPDRIQGLVSVNLDFITGLVHCITGLALTPTAENIAGLGGYCFGDLVRQVVLQVIGGSNSIIAAHQIIRYRILFRAVGNGGRSSLVLGKLHRTVRVHSKVHFVGSVPGFQVVFVLYLDHLVVTGRQFRMGVLAGIQFDLTVAVCRNSQRDLNIALYNTLRIHVHDIERKACAGLLTAVGIQGVIRHLFVEVQRIDDLFHRSLFVEDRVHMILHFKAGRVGVAELSPTETVIFTGIGRIPQYQAELRDFAGCLIDGPAAVFPDRGAAGTRFAVQIRGPAGHILRDALFVGGVDDLAHGGTCQAADLTTAGQVIIIRALLADNTISGDSNKQVHLAGLRAAARNIYQNIFGNGPAQIIIGMAQRCSTCLQTGDTHRTAVGIADADNAAAAGDRPGVTPAQNTFAAVRRRFTDLDIDRCIVIRVSRRIIGQHCGLST